MSLYAIHNKKSRHPDTYMHYVHTYVRARIIGNMKSSSSYSYIVIGLGNPGKEYEHTRHNAGRNAVLRFVKENNLSPFEENKKLRALASEDTIEKTKIWTVLPETFMNKSGITAKNLNIKNEAELIAAIRLLFPEYSNVTNANIEERVKEVKAIIPLYEILEKIFPNAEKRYGISYGIIDFLYNPEKKNLLVELISESTNPKQLYENIVYSFGNVKGLNEPASYEDLESYKNAQEEKLIPIDMEFTDFKRDLMAFKSENPKSTSEDYLDALEIKRLLETAYDIPTEEHPEEKPFEEPGSAQQISAQAVQGSAATHPAAPELSEMRTLPETEQSSLYNLLFEKGEVSLPEDVSAIQRAMEEAQIEQTSRTALEEDVH